MTDEAGKIVSPDNFIKAAERYGITPAIDRWVIENAFRWLVSEADERERLALCSINLSGQSLGDDKFLPFVIDQFHRSGLDASKICFEITETAAIASFSQANRFIQALKELGCKFALDDFGTGLSSFGYLKHFPVDFLKIDGSFVKEILHDPIDREMVRSINEIGHLTGKLTIAEFAENEEIIKRAAQPGRGLRAGLRDRHAAADHEGGGGQRLSCSRFTAFREPAWLIPETRREYVHVGSHAASMRRDGLRNSHADSRKPRCRGSMSSARRLTRHDDLDPLRRWAFRAPCESEANANTAALNFRGAVFALASRSLRRRASSVPSGSSFDEHVFFASRGTNRKERLEPAPPANSNAELEPHRKIDRPHVLGERPDRHEIDAGLRDRAQRLERDAAGRLELHRPARVRAVHRDRGAHVFEAELVEQRHVGAGVERLAQFVERLDLDFDRHLRAGRPAPHRPRRAIEPAAMMWFSLTRMPS